MVQFVHDIISNLDGAMNSRHKQTDLIIMDFAKAFDKVPHRRLLHKLDLLHFHKIHSGAESIEKDVPDPCSQFEIYQGITQCPIL